VTFPRYPKYKESGVEWLGEVPEHWEVTRLKYACHVFPSNVDKKSHEGETPVVLCNYTDVYYNEKITSAIEFMVATASREQIAKFALQAGDTIITKDSETANDIANAAYVPNDLPGVVCGYHLSMVRPYAHISGAFVSRIFGSAYAKAQFATLANGLTRVGLGQYELDNILLPFPPQEEQVEIAAFLDRETAKIDELVAEQRRLIELLKEKRQAVISHAVTKGLNPHAPLKPSGIEWLGDVPSHWTVKRLKHISPFITVGIVVNPSTFVSDNGFPFIYGGDIREGVIDWSNARRIDGTSSDANAKTRLNTGDLLTVRVGAPGITAVVPPECEGGNCASVMLIRRGQFNSSWLCYAMNTRAVRFQVEVVQYGAAQEQFNISHAVNFWTPVPPRSEQDDIARFIASETAKLDGLTAGAERSIELLQERRTALISAAVTGKIDVRGEAQSGRSRETSLSPELARQVLAAEILSCCHHHKSTGRVKLQKLIHLCEHHAELPEIHGSYLRQAYGPHDEAMMSEIVRGLRDMKWYREVRRKRDPATNTGRKNRYLPLEQAGEHVPFLDSWQPKLPRIREVLAHLGSSNTRRCEIVSTLYAAWNDLILAGEKPTDDEIIREASSPDRWHERKAGIPPERWAEELNWMKAVHLIPRGFGKRTVMANQKSPQN